MYLGHRNQLIGNIFSHKHLPNVFAHLNKYHTKSITRAHTRIINIEYTRWHPASVVFASTANVLTNNLRTHVHRKGLFIHMLCSIFGRIYLQSKSVPICSIKSIILVSGFCCQHIPQYKIVIVTFTVWIPTMLFCSAAFRPQIENVTEFSDPGDPLVPCWFCVWQLAVQSFAYASIQGLWVNTTRKFVAVGLGWIRFKVFI